MNPAPPPAEEAPQGDEARLAASKPESERAPAARDAQGDAAGPAAPEAAPAEAAPASPAPASAGKEFTVPPEAAAERRREDDAEDVHAPAEPPYGVELKAARERMGVRPADVAASLHLEESVVRAIEAGRQDELPARVYVRGYVRAYANLLGLDPDRLAVNFDSSQEAPEATAPPVVGTGTKAPRGRLSQRRAGLFLGTIVIVIVVALAFMLWGVWRSFDWSFVTDAGGEGAVAPAWRSEQAEGATKAPQPQAAIGQVPTATDAPQTVPDAHAPTAQAAPVAELVFTFKEDSWVEVSDRAEQVYADLGKAGQSVSVSGTPPFTIKIGYAAGVELRYLGEVIALAPHTQGSVANLVVH